MRKLCCLDRIHDDIVNSAVYNHAALNDPPKKLIIVSDIEFYDRLSGIGRKNIEKAKAKFEQQGYGLSEIVIRNVASRNRQHPVTMNDQGVACVHAGLRAFLRWRYMVR